MRVGEGRTEDLEHGGLHNLHLAHSRSCNRLKCLLDVTVGRGGRETCSRIVWREWKESEPTTSSPRMQLVR